jgi:uncharacterized protein YkwD
MSRHASTYFAPLFDAVESLWACFMNKPARKRPATAPRRERPRLEQLESRQLLSAAPTGLEQQFLERLNDARANPAAYGASIGLDLSSVAPAPPLAFDPRLIESARAHSQDMNDAAYFGHTGSDGSSPFQRMTAAGFPWVTAAESIAAGAVYATPEAALQGLIIDAGVADLGHRRQLLSIGSPFASQQEAGVGVFSGAGPLGNYYTIDQGQTADARPFLTGVVYNDANHNGKYDNGEGLGGVTVSVAGVGAVATWGSGGYSLQLNPGTYSVTFNGGGLAGPVTRQVTVGAINDRLNVLSSEASAPTPARPAARVPHAPHVTPAARGPHAPHVVRAADLNWAGGGLSGLPTTVGARTPFTVKVAYNVAGAAVGKNFTISYYASTDRKVGNGNDVLLAKETLTAAAYKTRGLHHVASPRLTLGRTGARYIYAVLDSGRAVRESNEKNNTVMSARPVKAVPQAPRTRARAARIIDNGDAGYHTTGRWYYGKGTMFNGAYLGDANYRRGGAGNNVATWSFTVTPGVYRVSATWAAFTNAASDARYTVLDGASVRARTTVNERQYPAGRRADGAVWKDIGVWIRVTGRRLTVRLDGKGNGYVIADAVRVEKIG